MGPEQEVTNQDVPPMGEEAPAESAADQSSEIERLRQDLEKERQAADDYMKRWQRAQADLINFRRRVEQERVEQAQLANQILLARLLPVTDDFERAFRSLPSSLERFTWIEGMALIARRLQYILEQEGVEQIDALGKPFNPVEHEAVMADEGVGPGEGVVVEVFQQGYRLRGRVLRPALVRLGTQAPEQRPTDEGAREAGQTEPSAE